MASGGTVVSADPRTVAYLRRFVTETAELERIYKEAAQAHLKRLTEVTITSASLDGEGGTGEIAGDPADLMAACEIVLMENADERPASQANGLSFSRRRVQT